MNTTHGTRITEMLKATGLAVLTTAMLSFSAMAELIPLDYPPNATDKAWVIN